MCALLHLKPSSRFAAAAGMSWNWGDDIGLRYAPSETDARGRRLPGTLTTLPLPVYAEPTVLAAAARALTAGQLPAEDPSAAEWHGATTAREAVADYRGNPAAPPRD
ncbi:hypothetical protein [Streptomyces sp. NPDC059881]|uniref:hypothetical protein n=1 Tax=Streptomyces sp. NPDC059881 TaxID=3346986 RepID=UPI00366105A4